MQAYKLKGKINGSGQLIITEPITLTPGDVEVIVLQTVSTDLATPRFDADSKSAKQVTCEIPSLKQWLEESPPVPPNFDPEQAKWEYLKEKHKL